MQRERGTGVVAAVLVAVVILSGAIFYRFTNPEGVKNLVQESSILAQSNIDTDGDGLSDAEELEWGSDPNRKDTDGDGTNDYTEVLTGRDPLIQGPYDVVDSSLLSITNVFADDFVVGYTDIIKEDGTVDREAEESLIETISERYTKKLAIEEEYTLDDLNTIPTTRASINNYRLTLQKVLGGLDGITERETTTMLKYHETKNPSELEKLDHAINTYDDVVAKLLTVPVPEDIAQLHLPVVNNINELSLSLASIRLTATDPLRGIVGVNTFLEKEHDLVIAAIYLGLYLEETL